MIQALDITNPNEESKETEFKETMRSIVKGLILNLTCAVVRVAKATLDPRRLDTEK